MQTTNLNLHLQKKEISLSIFLMLIIKARALYLLTKFTRVQVLKIAKVTYCYRRS